MADVRRQRVRLPAAHATKDDAAAAEAHGEAAADADEARATGRQEGGRACGGGDRDSTERRGRESSARRRRGTATQAENTLRCRGQRRIGQHTAASWTHL